MGKLTKKNRIKVLEWQVKTLIQSMTNIEEWSSCADNMLTELNHALPDPEYDAKCEAQEADIDASLDRHRERLGLNKPQLKQLDQSIFDGLDEKWRFAAVGKNGSVYKFRFTPKVSGDDSYLCDEGYHKCSLVGEGYDASNWQNSLIERESVELTGSDLCHEMLKRGDKAVMCKINESNHMTIIVGCKESKLGGWVFHSHRHSNHYIVTPINNQGEPLTQAEAGL